MSKRPAMLASVIRESIAPMLRTCPPECGIVAITDIDVSPDISFATVYISALREPKLALEYMEQQRMTMQRGLSALHRKRIPMLRFRIDPRPERAGRLDQLLQG